MAIATFIGRYARAVLMLFMTLYALLISTQNSPFYAFLQTRDILTDRQTRPLVVMRGRI